MKRNNSTPKRKTSVYLDEDNIDKINSRINELGYNPDSIAMKKSICEELYKNGKYYLG